MTPAVSGRYVTVAVGESQRQLPLHPINYISPVLPFLSSMLEMGVEEKHLT